MTLEEWKEEMIKQLWIEKGQERNMEGVSRSIVTKLENTMAQKMEESKEEARMTQKDEG